jgi:hypothetical protein
MTPETKYQELFSKFNDVIPPNHQENIDDSIAVDIKATKECVKIAVDELIKVAKFFKLYEEILYWQLVKKELTKNKNK